MIDFRFFIISIVAVFLALGLGIVIGSGFLRDIDDVLENRIDAAVERERDLRAQFSDLENERDSQDEFIETLAPSAVDERLAGEEIVMVEVEGTDEALTSGLEQSIEDADGTIAMRLRLTDKLSLDDDQAVEELAATLDSTSPNTRELRNLLGLLLGERLAQAVTPPERLDSNRDRSQVRARSFLTTLQEDGFVTVLGVGQIDFPQNALFLAAAGAAGEPAWPAAEVIEPLAFTRSSEGELGVVVAESEESEWGITQAVRNDPRTSDVVSTIDNAETPAGRIATVIGLSLAPATTGHWGSDDGATAPAPTPPPG